MLQPLSNRIFNKYDAEMAFWQSRYKIDQGVFSNSHYEQIFLQMAEEEWSRVP